MQALRHHASAHEELGRFLSAAVMPALVAGIHVLFSRQT
jgi:hypothetical protein